MRLILVDRLSPSRIYFEPLVFGRPIWDLRCGITTLVEKLVAKFKPRDVAGFLPDYMADAYREQSTMRVNDAASLSGDDLLVVNARVKAEGHEISATGPSEAQFDADGEFIFARIAAKDLSRLKTDSIDSLLASAVETLPKAEVNVPRWKFVWELVLSNGEQIVKDFAAFGRHGVKGTLEQPTAIRGDQKNVYVAPEVLVHPMVVIDAAHGPVYIDDGAEIHPFTRIEGPCYIGKKTTLFGAKCREGNSIGPVCRVGGEVEESIIQGHSNKYHDGFLGHAYVGEWVNLGALTTNSDLKNDYSNVSVTLDGKSMIDTGSKKVGSLIGDHTKTSIGTLLNTGAYVGAMGLIAGTGKPLPKFIPSFSWFLEGMVTKGFGKRKLYETAKAVMGRRGREWTAAQESMWDAVFQATAEPRNEAIKKGRRELKSR